MVRHFTSPRFWQHYEALPSNVRELAVKNYALLKSDPSHPSLRFKKTAEGLWSVRVGRQYRALAVERREGLLWFWIGTHTEYDNLLG
jgi:hypothetical protein